MASTIKVAKKVRGKIFKKSALKAHHLTSGKNSGGVKKLKSPMLDWEDSKKTSPINPWNFQITRIGSAVPSGRLTKRRGSCRSNCEPNFGKRFSWKGNRETLFLIVVGPGVQVFRSKISKVIFYVCILYLLWLFIYVYICYLNVSLLYPCSIWDCCGNRNNNSKVGGCWHADMSASFFNPFYHAPHPFDVWMQSLDALFRLHTIRRVVKRDENTGEVHRRSWVPRPCQREASL